MAFPDESYELMMSGLGGIPAQAPAPLPIPLPPPPAPPVPTVTPAAASTPPTLAAPGPSAPAQPGGQETVEALRQLLAQFQTRAATPRAESQSGGLLDALRQRVQAQMAGEDDRRLRDIGIGMLASRSPNFFSMLGEGFKAGEEGSRARMDRLRQAAETERQERALDVEEARRQEELRIREAAQAAEAPLRAAQTEQALANAAFLRSGRGRGEITRADILRIGAQAEAHALRQVREPVAGSPEAIGDTPAKARDRQEQRARIARAYIEGQYALLGMEPPAAVAGAPEAGAAGGASAPDRILTFTPTTPGAARTGPRIAPPQQ